MRGTAYASRIHYEIEVFGVVKKIRVTSSINMFI